MVDFNTLKGIDGYRAAFPTVFEGLDDATTQGVVEAAHNGVLSGWEPTTVEMQSLGEYITRPGPASMSRAEVRQMLTEVTGEDPQERDRQRRLREIDRRGAHRARVALEHTMRERGYTIDNPVDTDEAADSTDVTQRAPTNRPWWRFWR